LFVGGDSIMNAIPSTVIGLDVSLTSTGLIALAKSGDIVRSRVIESPPCGPSVRSRMRRIEKIVTEIKTEIESLRPSIICIEAYSYGSNTPGNAARIELGGLLRYVICANCGEVHEVAPSTLKKFACGKGNAKGKTLVAVALSQRYGVTFQTDDEYDAYALARMALQIAGYDKPANESQREAIAAATQPKEKKPKKARGR
jgi:crossover junction endodeoxyribonuclease RuvC